MKYIISAVAPWVAVFGFLMLGITVMPGLITTPQLPRPLLMLSIFATLITLLTLILAFVRSPRDRQAATAVKVLVPAIICVLIALLINNFVYRIVPAIIPN